MKDHGDPPPGSEHLPSLTGEKPSIEKGFEMFGGEPSPLPEPDPSPPSDATTPVESVLGDISRPLIDAFSGEDLRSGDRPPGTPSEPAPAPKQWWIGDAALWLQSMMGGGKRADQGEPPLPPPDEAEEEGLDIPSISVTGVGEKSREEQMHEAFGTPLPEKPEPPLRVPEGTIGLFSPRIAPALWIFFLLTLGIGGYFAFGRPAEQAPTVASPLVTTQLAQPTTQATPTTAATSARRPRIVSSTASSVPPRVGGGSCQLKYSWTLADVESTDLIRIHFTGLNSRPGADRDVQVPATIATNYKDGVLTWFGFGEERGGEYTAEVIELGPTDRQGRAGKPEGPTLVRTTC